MNTHQEKFPKLPKFLARKRRKPLTDEELARLLGTNRQREWAPIRKRGEWSEKPTMPLMADNPHLPVKVQVKGKEAGSVLLATYASMAEFERKHNKATYPVKGQPYSFATHTVILVTAKPWAGKKDDAEKRTGPKPSAVQCNGTTYDSVLAAFQALHLPISKHQKFRAELKLKRKLAFAFEGKKFKFSY